MFHFARTVNFFISHQKITLLLTINVVILICNISLFNYDKKVDTTLENKLLVLEKYVDDIKIKNIEKQFAPPLIPTTSAIGNYTNIDLQKGKKQKISQDFKILKLTPKEIQESPNEIEEKNRKNNQNVDYSTLRKTYEIPSIETTDLINCHALLSNNTKELIKAEEIMKTKIKVPIYEETYLKWTENCKDFKRQRGYVMIPLSEEEENFPLAFSISMYTDPESTERLLRAIYQPQNIYCIHIDIKSPLLLHRTIRGIADCFPNVFVASHLDKIKWGDVSVLLPAINCMRDLDRYYRGKWKYYINLTGQEMPLRTNWELVQITKIFNGSNDIAGSIPRVDPARVNHFWTHRWSKTYQQTIFFDTERPKAPFNLNLTFYKGELHGLFTQRMVNYIVNDPVSKEYLKWCWDSGHPSEHYWNTLNYNVKLKAPGGYEGPLDIADKYSYTPIIRAKHWPEINYGKRECQGKVVRGICVYGVGDLPWLNTRKELVANKFHLTYQYLAYDCLEQRQRERTKMRDKVSIDLDFYRKLPTVLYSRKDGYFNR